MTVLFALSVAFLCGVAASAAIILWVQTLTGRGSVSGLTFPHADQSRRLDASLHRFEAQYRRAEASASGKFGASPKVRRR